MIGDIVFKIYKAIKMFGYNITALAPPSSANSRWHSRALIDCAAGHVMAPEVHDTDSAFSFER